MNSSIYSIVLKDDLMKLVDGAAIEKRMSRSQIFNEIVAEYFNLITPEYKINKIMDMIAGRIRIMNEMQYISQAKGSSIQCRATVGFKYNPKVRYMLELSGKDRSKLATLKIMSRTQNPVFYQHLIRFFQMIEKIEKYNESGFRKNSIKKGRYMTSANRFTREFYYDWMHEDISIEDISEFLSNYMEMIHSAMNLYFSNAGQSDETLYKLLFKVYRDYV